MNLNEGYQYIKRDIYKNEMTYILNIMKELFTIKPDIVSLIKNKFDNIYVVVNFEMLLKK